MFTKATVRAWGGSLAIPISKKDLKHANMCANDEVILVIEKGKIVVYKYEAKSFAEKLPRNLNLKDFKFDREEANER